MRGRTFCIGWRGKTFKVTLSRIGQVKGAMGKTTPQRKKQNHKGQEAFEEQKRGQCGWSGERQGKEMGQNTFIRPRMWVIRPPRRLA